MPSRQRSNPLLGSMDSPSPHIHRHRGSHSSSISEQRSTAVCALALNHSAAESPGPSMHPARLALRMHSVHACCAVTITLPLHQASSAAVRHTFTCMRFVRWRCQERRDLWFTVAKNLMHMCSYGLRMSVMSCVSAQTLRLLAATALVGMVLLAFAGELLLCCV